MNIYYQDSDEMFASSDFILEATSCEYLHLWEEHSKKLQWSERKGGFLVTVGYIGTRPICIEIFLVTLNTKNILIYNGCSALVDHTMIEDFLLTKGFTVLYDAMNFHNLKLKLNKEK